MDDRQKAKLAHYLANARGFLWGLGPGYQRKNYQWLESLGFTFTRGTYDDVTYDLLHNNDIGKIIEEAVIPQVTKKFTEEFLAFLRRCWEQGTLPTRADLARQKMAPVNAYPFLEVQAQHDYIEGWGVFAGLWFEEIEPLFRPSKSLYSESQSG